MGKEPLSDDSFIKKYEAYEAGASESRVDRYAISHAELREFIAYLVDRRTAMKHAELERLEAEAAQLIDKLKSNEKQQLLEELVCFKDVLALQKQLLDENEKP